MKTAGWLSLGLSFLLSVGFVAGGGDAKKDKEKLQGTWNGKKGDIVATMKIKGDKFEFTMGEEVHKGTFKLKPDAKPREIDMMVTESKKYEGKTSRAIYDVDGDTFKWAANEPGKDARPADFAGEFLIIEFRRAKK